MPNHCGKATTTTIITPILPGREDELQAELLRLPTGDEGPFERLGTTHFARWVLIDRVEYEVEDQLPDGLESHYLLFNAVFDGSLGAFIDGMLDHFPEVVDGMWENCVGYPGSAQRQEVHRYFRHNELEATFFFSAYQDSTLSQIRKALALRERLTRFAIAAQGLPAAELQARFSAEFRS